jgi:hypothetical protein
VILNRTLCESSISFWATLVAAMEQPGTEWHVRYWLYVAAATPEQRLIVFEGK